MISQLTRVLRAIALTALTLLVLAPSVALVVWIAHHAGAITGISAAIAVGALLIARVIRRATGVRRGTTLEWDVPVMPAAAAPANPIEAATTRALNLRDTVDTLTRAASDRRVSGLIAHIGLNEATMADVQELRDAVLAFRKAGKRATAFAETYGNAAYYLASAFDTIIVQPAGEVGLVGFGRDVNFLRGALDKAGVRWDSGTRYEYKNAYNQLTETKFTKPHKEATQRVLDCMHDQLVTGVATARSLERQRVQELLDGGPQLSEEALVAGLVDKVAYRDEAIAHAQGGGAKNAPLLYLDRYRKRTKKPQRGDTVALVTATGAIISRKEGGLPIAPGGVPMDASVISAALRKAAADKRVKAIVLRVSSPGGSAVASETIRREVVRARQQGKPVVVSMGSVAASGGYWISCDADYIVAQPGTVTGSIGVLIGKPVLAAAKDSLGINVERLATGKHATMLSLNRPFARTEKARIDASLDDIYTGFTQRVADGRKKTHAEVHEIARGRVWVGTDALDCGLVDELGGLAVAVAAAKRKAGIKPDAPVKLKAYPKEGTPFDQLRKKKRESSEDHKAALALMQALAPLVPTIADLVQSANAAGLLTAPGALYAGFDAADWTVR